MKFPQMNFRLPSTISIITGTLIICSCSFFAPEIVPDSSKELLEEGIKALKLDQDIRARTLFKQVIEDFPDSKERTQALLLLARSHYSFEEYEEAKFHFQEFIELHPAHKYADRAYFFKAMSDYQMMGLASRDQTATQEALDGFKQFINRFPKSQYLEEAKKKLRKCNFKLAQNILEIGKFYYRTGSYHSAIPRLKNLLTDHSQQKFFDEAAFLLAESYYHEQSFDEASMFYKKLLKEYPRSRFTLEAKKRLRALRK